MTDLHPEGNAAPEDPFALGQAVPYWQAAIIRLARPALLWALGGNYRPASGSPVIGAGLAVTGNEYANDYVTRPDPPAIGALEAA